MMSNTGQTVRIRMGDVRVMGRSTQGVRLVSLHEGDYLVGVQKIEHVEESEVTPLPADQPAPEVESVLEEEPAPEEPPADET